MRGTVLPEVALDKWQYHVAVAIGVPLCPSSPVVVVVNASMDALSPGDMLSLCEVTLL